MENKQPTEPIEQSYVSAILSDYNIPFHEVEYSIINESDIQPQPQSQPLPSHLQQLQSEHNFPDPYKLHVISSKIDDIDHNIRQFKRFIPHLNSIKTMQDTIDAIFKAILLFAVGTLIVLFMFLIYIMMND
jgi:hypothetical protein